MHFGFRNAACVQAPFRIPNPSKTKNQTLKKTKIMKKLLTIIGLAAATLAGANAAVLLDQDFNSFTNGDLVSQGSWVQTGATATNPIQVSSGIVSLAQGANQDANRPFTPAVTSGSIYYFATINVASKNGTADYFIHLGDGGVSNFGARLYGKSTGAGYQLAWGGGVTAPTTFGAELAFGTSYNVVFRYNIISGTLNDTGKLYVSSGDFNSNEASNTAYQDVTVWTGGTEVTSFSAMYFRQGTSTGSESIDQIKIATTFAEAIPEPKTWVLIGIGTSFMLWNLRRRRRVQG
jgi:hypothetical protein